MPLPLSVASKLPAESMLNNFFSFGDVECKGPSNVPLKALTVVAAADMLPQSTCQCSRLREEREPLVLRMAQLLNHTAGGRRKLTDYSSDMTKAAQETNA